MKAVFVIILIAVLSVEVITAARKPSRKGMTSGAQLLSKDLSSSLPEGNLNIGLRQDFLLQDCGGDGLKQSFPDIDYSMFGYNVLRGYPLADGHDPGFTLPIFTADYSEQTHTSDCRFSVPKGLVVVPDVSCDISFSSKISQTSYQYDSYLSTSANVNGGGWGVSFSASVGYNKATSELSSRKSVYIISKASCTQYFSKMIPKASPPLHPVFLQSIERLKKSDNEAEYFNFFDTFGTHFPTMVTYGARFTQEHKMDSVEFEKKRKSGVDVEAQASYSGLFSVGGGFGMDASQRQQASDFQSSVKTKTVTVGAPPPSDGDAMTWASTVKNNPVPVQYHLESIENVFSYLTPNTYKDVQKVIDNIKQYKTAYCTQLKIQGDVNACEYSKPGLELKGTMLSIQVVSYMYPHETLSQCINHCIDEPSCLAVAYCVNCQQKQLSHSCIPFPQANTTTTMIAREEFWSYIFLGKIRTPFEIDKSSINGTPLDFDPKNKVVDKGVCQELCEGDIRCDAYTYNRVSKDWKCRFYQESMITALVEDPNSSITFV